MGVPQGIIPELVISCLIIVRGGVIPELVIIALGIKAIPSSIRVP
jgi:hypothetical protein